MILSIKLRTCLFHVTTLATSWSGHVHISTPLGDSHLLVGLCKECSKWEKWHYKHNLWSLSNNSNGCAGCYGKYTGSLR